MRLCVRAAVRLCLRRIYEVDPLACPRCAAPMRIVAVITDPAVIIRILVHRARSLERARLSASGYRLSALGYRLSALGYRLLPDPLPR